jgi:hypothetical protein
LRLALRPRSSRLPPGAANKAEKAKKGEENGPDGYGSGVGAELVDRHVHAAAIARHDDGDGAAILTVEQAHGAGQLLRGSPRRDEWAECSRDRGHVKRVNSLGERVGLPSAKAGAAHPDRH